MWEKIVTQKANFSSLLKFLAHREKRRILRKYWILKTNYIYKFPCSSVPSVVCTVKIEFSSELISQIRGVILYLADSEHWTRSRFRPVSSAPEMGPFIKCGGGGVLQPMITPPVLLSSCSLLLGHLILSRGRVSVPSPSHPTYLLFLLSSLRRNVSQKLVMSFSHFGGRLFWI